MDDFGSNHGHLRLRTPKTRSCVTATTPVVSRRVGGCRSMRLPRGAHREAERAGRRIEGWPQPQVPRALVVGERPVVSRYRDVLVAEVVGGCDVPRPETNRPILTLGVGEEVDVHPHVAVWTTMASKTPTESASGRPPGSHTPDLAGGGEGLVGSGPIAARDFVLPAVVVSETPRQERAGGG